jgi:PhoPQ-activated pathogenicity-related protein
MQNKNQVSVLLGVCIIPQIIAEIKEMYSNDETTAIREFYKSGLFEKLQNPATGLWRLSAKTLAQIYYDKNMEFPEEQ